MSIKLGLDVFDSPCTKDYRPAQFDPHMSVMVHGTGDYSHCLRNVTELFSFSKCPYSKCSFDGVFQPEVTGSFMVRDQDSENPESVFNELTYRSTKNFPSRPDIFLWPYIFKIPNESDHFSRTKIIIIILVLFSIIIFASII